MDPIDLTHLTPFVGLLVGAALRTVLPYVVNGLEQVKQHNDWMAWPPFEAGYLASLALAAVGFAVAFVTVPGLFEAFLGWEFVASVALAYSGQDLGRQVLKTVDAVRGLGPQE